MSHMKRFQRIHMIPNILFPLASAYRSLKYDVEMIIFEDNGRRDSSTKIIEKIISMLRVTCKQDELHISPRSNQTDSDQLKLFFQIFLALFQLQDYDLANQALHEMKILNSD